MRRAIGPILCVLLAGPAVYACPIPVFRYALEFWEPDRYEAEIVHRGPLSAAAKAAADLLTEYAEDENAPVNLVVRFTDVEESAYADFKVADQPFDLPAARLMVRCPSRDGKSDPVWDVPLTTGAVEKLVDSPARREIARRLLDGESAVWILLESGDRQADDAAAALLQEQLKRLQATLRLPEALTSQMGPAALAESEPELRLSFSMLRVARDDAAEAFFAAMLTGSKSNRSDAGKPVVVPVFGRGRALDPLVGEGINAQRIGGAGRFLVGPCSCRAKALNPGHDLLMQVDWEAKLGGSLLEVIDLPPLVGVSTLADDAADSPGTDAATTQPATSVAAAASAVFDEAAPRPAHASSGLVRNMLIVLAFIVVAVTFVALRIGRRPARDHS